MGMITPVPEAPHPLDVSGALTLIEINLRTARREADYWAKRIADLEAAQAEWEAKK